MKFHQTHSGCVEIPTSNAISNEKVTERESHLVKLFGRFFGNFPINQSCRISLYFALLNEFDRNNQSNCDRADLAAHQSSIYGWTLTYTKLFPKPNLKIFNFINGENLRRFNPGLNNIFTYVEKHRGTADMKPMSDAFKGL